jgi:hypothetical protein
MICLALVRLQERHAIAFARRACEQRSKNQTVSAGLRAYPSLSS